MVRLLVAICMQKYYAKFRTYLANHKENVKKVPNEKERVFNSKKGPFPGGSRDQVM